MCSCVGLVHSMDYILWGFLKPICFFNMELKLLPYLTFSLPVSLDLNLIQHGRCWIGFVWLLSSCHIIFFTWQHQLMFNPVSWIRNKLTKRLDPKMRQRLPGVNTPEEPGTETTSLSVFKILYPGRHNWPVIISDLGELLSNYVAVF